MTLFEALMGGGFDRRNWQHGGEFDQNFQKSQMPWGLPGGGGWAVLKLTGTLLIEAFLIISTVSGATKIQSWMMFRQWTLNEKT